MELPSVSWRIPLLLWDTAAHASQGCLDFTGPVSVISRSSKIVFSLGKQQAKQIVEVLGSILSSAWGSSDPASLENYRISSMDLVLMCNKGPQNSHGQRDPVALGSGYFSGEEDKEPVSKGSPTYFAFRSWEQGEGGPSQYTNQIHFELHLTILIQSREWKLNFWQTHEGHPSQNP